MVRMIAELLKMKEEGRKIAVLTSYDYTLASLCDRAGVDALLVGDSAGMVMLGYDNTVSVTMDQMCMFTSAVARARKNALVIADMPFMSYQTSIPDAIRNAGRLVEAGADAVKLEGGAGSIGNTVRALVDIGIPVMGHIGLQPQTTAMYGYRTRGMTAEDAGLLIEEAEMLEESGVFAITLEKVASQVSGIISSTVSVPTIGIGSGGGCDGQVLVVQDMLGMYDKINPGFVKKYAELSGTITDAVKGYVDDVKAGEFPKNEHSSVMDKAEFDRLRGSIEK